jgi:hypothetical protein
MPQWEYYTTFLSAEINTQKHELIKMFPDINHAPKYDPPRPHCSPCALLPHRQDHVYAGSRLRQRWQRGILHPRQRSGRTVHRARDRTRHRVRAGWRACAL